LFNLNLNHSCNQTYINIKPISTKSTFYKTTFFKPQPQKLTQYQTHYIFVFGPWASLHVQPNHMSLFHFGDKYQGCQFCFDRCFVFSIGMKCFSFGVIRRAISGLYCSYIYNSTNIIQIQDKLIINYAIQTQYQTNRILKFKIFLNSQY